MVGRKNGKRLAPLDRQRSDSLRAAVASIPLMESLERRLMLSVSGQALVQGLFMAGSTFNYTLTGSNGGTAYETFTAKGKATAPTGGQSAYEFDIELTNDQNTDVSSDQNYIASTSSGIVEYEDVSTEDYSSGETDYSNTDDDTYTPPEFIVPLNLTVGQQYSSDYTDTDNYNDGSGDSGTTSTSSEDATITVAQETTITVPAGTFDVYQLHDVDTTTNYNDDGSVASTDTSSAEIYLSPGIGIIEESVDGDDGVVSQLTSYTLVGDKLSFPTTPADTVAGQTIPPVTVDVLNSDGTIDTTSSAAIKLSLLGGDGTLSGTTTLSAVNGVATFSGLSIDKSGDYTFQANSIDGSGPVTSNQFKITGDKLVFTSEPGDSELNASIPMTVMVEDQNNAVDTDADGTIDLSLNTVSGGQSAVLGGTISVDIVAGVGKFTTSAGPTIDTAGTYTFTATQDDDSGSPVDTTTTGTSDEFTVSNSLIWTAGGDGVSWSDPKNWDKDAAPEDGGDLIFPADHSGNSNNDISGLTIDTIDIVGGGYNLTGNSISLTGGLTSEAGNNTYAIDTKLVGSPTLEDDAGDLTVNAVISGDGMTLEGTGIFTLDDTDSLSGPVSLGAGVTLDDDALNGALGTGTVTIDAGASPVSIDADGSGPSHLANNVTFQDGANLETDPEVDIDGTVTVDGDNGFETKTAEDVLNITAAIDGTGTLHFSGAGVAAIKGTVANGVVLEVDSGELDLEGNLQGTGTTPQVTVDEGGVAVMTSDLKGGGAIDVVSGTLVTDESDDAAGSASYTGTVILETGGTIKYYDTTDANGLGTGTLDIKGGTIQNSTDAFALVGNPVTLEGNVTISSPDGTPEVPQGFYFKGDTTVKSESTVILSGGAALFTGFSGQQVNIDGTGLFGTTTRIDAPMSLSNEGIDYLGGTISESSGDNGTDVLVEGANTVVELFAGGAEDGQVASSVTGDGGVEVSSGTLVTDETDGAPGLSSYDGTITLDADGTIKYYDTADANGLGTGTIDIKGGTIQNSTDAFALVGNPITLEGNVTISSPDGTADDPQGFYFKGDTTVKSESTITLSGGSTLFTGFSGQQVNIAGAGVLGTTTRIDAPMSLSNEGIDYLGGTISESSGDNGTDVLVEGANTVVELFAGGAEDGQVASSVTGDGGVEVSSGTLVTDETDGAPGLSSYDGTITLDADGTIKYYDTADADGLGTGTLDIKGGTIQNSTDGLALVGNPITLEGAVTISSPDGTTEDPQGFYFKGDATVKSESTITLSGGIDLFTGFSGEQLNIDGTGTLGTTTRIDAPMTLSNEGTDYLGGTISESDGENGTEVLVEGTNTVVELFAGGAEDGQIASSVTGDGGVEVSSGTLVTDETEDAPGLSSYDGTITLDTDGTIKYYDAQDGDGLGTGTLDLKGGTFQNSSDTLAEIDNPIKLEGNVTFSSPAGTEEDPQGLYFTGDVSVTAANTTTLTGAILIFKSVTGSQITFDGTGSVGITDSISAPLEFSNDGTDEIGGIVTAPEGGGTTILVNGANTVLELFSGGTTDGEPIGAVTGDGGIDVIAGTLVTDEIEGAAGLSGYTGNITLEAGGTIKMYDTQDGEGLGKGTLDIKGGLIQNSASALATIDNPVTLEGNVTLSTDVSESGTEGLYFSGDITAKTASTITISGGDIVALETLTGGPQVTIAGTGEVWLVKSVSTPVLVNLDGKAYLTGTLADLSQTGDDGGDQGGDQSGDQGGDQGAGDSLSPADGTTTSTATITVDGTDTVLYLDTTTFAGSEDIEYQPLNGDGDIDVKTGTLVTDEGEGAEGLPSFAGTITLESGGTIKVYDAVDGIGLGTGTLDVKGGVIQNDTGTIAQVDNAVKLEGGVTLSSPGDLTDDDVEGFYFSGDLTNVTMLDTITLSGGISYFKSLNGPQINFDGTGAMGTTDAINAPLQLANTGVDELGGVIAPAEGGATILVNGAGTVGELFSGFTNDSATLASITGEGGIEVMAGTLVTDEIDDAAGISGYAGDITLDAGGTLKDYDTQDGDGFGTGKLDIKGGTIQNATGTLVTIDDPITLEGNVALSSPEDPEQAIDFTGDLTATAASTINLSGGLFYFKTLNGSAQINVAGTGSLGVTDKVNVALQLGNTGNDEIGGTITPSDDGDPTIGVNGAGTVLELYAGSGSDSEVTIDPLSGAGGIEVVSGTLVTDEGDNAAGLSGFTGDITLDPDGTIKYYDKQDDQGLGTGKLDIKGGTIQNSTGSLASIANPITLEGNVTLSSPGSTEEAIDFTGDVTTKSTSTLDLASGGTVYFKTLNGLSQINVTGTGSLGITDTVNAALQLGNTGIDEIGGAITPSDDGDPTIAVNGTGTVLELYAGSSSDVTINPISGSGAIEVLSGTLVTDETSDAGISGYTGTITLDPGGTIKYYDTQDGNGLGTGTLDLKGGTLQNSSGGFAEIDNPITVEGNVKTSSQGEKLKLAGKVTLTSGSIDIIGTLALVGGVSGNGGLTLDGDELDVAGSNPQFTGPVAMNSGTIVVSQDDALGDGDLVADLEDEGLLQSTSSIDPVLDNPLTVESGTLNIQGQFTFPAGVTVDAGTSLNLEGTTTQVVVPGPLAGAGNVVTNDESFQATGNTSGFTGSIGGVPVKLTPTVTVVDAGGAYTGSPFTATVTLSASGVSPTSELDGVSPTVTYYSGSTATGTPLSGAPSAIGTYTVVASFPGSNNFNAAQSNPIVFTITAATNPTNPTNPTTVPNGPFALAALTVSPTEIDLFWHSNSNNESGFAVERATGNGSFIVVKTLPAGSTSYQDTQLSASTTYEYRVRAFNSLGNSSYTGVATATTLATGETPITPPATLPTTVPNAPYSLNVTPYSASQIHLAWHDNPSDEAGYAIERSHSSGGWTVIKLLPLGTTSFDDVGLNASTSYTYRIYAYNALGDSSYAGPAMTSTLSLGSAGHVPTSAPTATTVPNGPFGLTAHATPGAGVSLQWHDNSDNETGFVVERQTGNGLFTPIAELAADSISFVDTTAAAGETYMYRVFAFNDVGDSSIATSLSVMI